MSSLANCFPGFSGEGILAVYDAGEDTREDIARRFRVSLCMVRKLIQQRRHTGDIAPRHPRAGRKPMILGRAPGAGCVLCWGKSPASP